MACCCCGVRRLSIASKPKVRMGWNFFCESLNRGKSAASNAANPKFTPHEKNTRHPRCSHHTGYHTAFRSEGGLRLQSRCAPCCQLHFLWPPRVCDLSSHRLRPLRKPHRSVGDRIEPLRLQLLQPPPSLLFGSQPSLAQSSFGGRVWPVEWRFFLPLWPLRA